MKTRGKQLETTGNPQTPGRNAISGNQGKAAQKEKHGNLGGFSLPVILSGMAGCLVVTFLFYNRLWGLIPGIPAGIYVALQVRRTAVLRGIRKRRETFRRLLLSMETGLEAGYSLENALYTAVEDMERVYRSGSEMGIMLENLRKRVRIGCPVWQAILKMGEEEEIEEAKEFAEVLAIQQRTGGNMIRTMRNTVDKIQAGIEVQQEIDSVIAEKRLEQRIMTLMPGIILCYMRLMNASYMKPLYTTAAGVLVMTAALGLNILGDFLGSKIVG